MFTNSSRFLPVLIAMVATIALCAPATAQSPCNEACISVEISDLVLCANIDTAVDTSPGRQGGVDDAILVDVPYTVVNCSTDSARVELRCSWGTEVLPPIFLDLAADESRELTLPVVCEEGETVVIRCSASAMIVNGTCSTGMTAEGSLSCVIPGVVVTAEPGSGCGTSGEASIDVMNPTAHAQLVTLECTVNGAILPASIELGEIAGGASVNVVVPVECTSAGTEVVCVAVASLVVDPDCVAADTVATQVLCNDDACVTVEVASITSCVNSDGIDTSPVALSTFTRGPGSEIVVPVPVTVTNCTPDSATVELNCMVGAESLPARTLVLGPDETRSIDIPVVCTDPGVITVSCTALLSLLNNPTCTATGSGQGTVECIPHTVAITKNIDPDTADRDDPVTTVSLFVENTGDIALEPVRVTDHLPSGVEFVALGSANDCGALLSRVETLADGRSRVVFSDFRLEPRESCTMTFQVQCIEFSGEDMVDTAFVEAFCDGEINLEPATDFDTALVACRAPECGLALSVTATPEIVIPVPPVDCESAGRPTSMTFRWTGGGCDASDNNQDEGKTDCSGRADESLPVTVRVGGGKDGNTFYNVSPTEISLGGTFTITAEKIESESVIWLTNAGGTERNRIHTSCSQPFIMGNRFGSLTLVGFNEVLMQDEVTFTYEVVNEGSDLEDVRIEDDLFGLVAGPFPLAHGQSRKVEREWNTEVGITVHAEATGRLAGTDKICTAADSAEVTVVEPEEPCLECDGGVTELTLRYIGSSPVTAFFDAGDASFGPEEVVFGQEITLESTDGDKLDDTDIFVNGTHAGEIHMSCSQPVFPGVTFGDFEIVSGRSKKNGPFCPVTLECLYSLEEIKIDDHKIELKIDNLGATYLTVERLEITWPEQNGPIRKIELKDRIFEGRRNPTSTVFQRTDWEGKFTGRSIEPGHDETLKIEFTDSIVQDLRAYEIRVIFTAPDCVLEITPETLPEPDACDNGKPAILAFEYTAGDCTASIHDQKSGKVECENYRTAPESGYAIARDGGKIWYSGPVHRGETFEIDARNAGEDKLKSDTTLQLFTADPDRGGRLVQEVEFHTSCSQPLRIGNTFGAFTLRGFVSEDELKLQNLDLPTTPGTALRAFPNPVLNTSATIQFLVPEGAAGDRVELQVFDVTGRLVRRLYSGPREAGLHAVTWNLLNTSGRAVPTGVYFYSLAVGGERFTKRLLVVSR